MDNMTEAEKALIVKLKRIVGYVPVGILDLLHVLTHPDIIDLTMKYIESHEENNEEETGPCNYGHGF